MFLIAASGGSAAEVKTGLTNAAAPVWSPDGNHLLILGEKDFSLPGVDSADWWVVPVGGGVAAQTGAFASFRRQGLKLRLMTTTDPMPFPREWTEAGILFSASSGDSVDLWQVPIVPGSWRIENPAMRLSSVPGFAAAGTTARDGRAAFASLTSRTHLWSLPANPDRGVVTGSPQQITVSDLSDVWPSGSLDGRVLAYNRSTMRNSDIWVKDLVTGEESALAVSEADEILPRVSADGRTVAYSILAGEYKGIYVLRPGASRPRRISEEPDLVYGVSPGGRYLLVKTGQLRRARLMDADSGQASEILHDPDGELFQSNFSPDGRWITFMDLSGILVAPFRGPGVIPKKDWIRITSGGHFDDKPRWSPDGNSMLFTADRDGFRCLWM